jgi:hypothetical protein
MTYNFDPDRWYERHRSLLEARRANGELDDEQLERELDDLERRYDEMSTRLDKPFQLPSRGPAGQH